VRIFLACAIAVVATTLSGCAYVQTDVRVTGSAGLSETGRTFSLARTSPQSGDPGHGRYEAQVRDALIEHGFVEAAPDAVPRPRYRVSIAHDTHPATAGIAEADCGHADPNLADNGTAGCTPVEAKPVIGRGTYVHSLTLRFFDWADGSEVYKVAVAERDDEKDAASAAPYLVKSAFAKLPYTEHPDWRVKLREAKTPGAPEVISVTPLAK
jgi:hypothetical protein